MYRTEHKYVPKYGDTVKKKSVPSNLLKNQKSKKQNNFLLGERRPEGELAHTAHSTHNISIFFSLEN
jgi:hypothetical protein